MLERVLIGDETYFVHQAFSEYGCDELLNPYFLGQDYLESEIYVLSRDKALSGEGDIQYTFEVILLDDNGSSQVTSITHTEDIFIGYCTVELDDKKKPTGIHHVNGDKWDNCTENLQWIYSTSE
jgi:hypothetical protein